MCFQGKEGVNAGAEVVFREYTHCEFCDVL
jgi:hypothetical protein